MNRGAEAGHCTETLPPLPGVAGGTITTWIEINMPQPDLMSSCTRHPSTFEASNCLPPKDQYEYDPVCGSAIC